MTSTIVSSTRARIILIVCFVIVSVLSLQCFKQPLAPVAPNWDVQLSVPIVDTVYFLKDALRGNPDIKVSGLGTYEYRPVRYNFPSVVVADPSKLQLIPPQTDTTTVQRLGLLSVDTPPPFSETIRASDIFNTPPFVVPPDRDTTFEPFPPPPAPCVICSTPSFPINDSVTIVLSDQFGYLQLSSGQISLTISNTFPMQLLFSPSEPVQLLDEDGSVIASFPFSAIGIGESQTQSSSLAGVKLTSTVKVKIKGVVDSTSLPVTFQAGAAIGLQFNITGPLQANKANVRIPPTLLANSSIKQVLVDDSTFVQRVLFNEGQVRISLNNNIGVGVSLHFKFREFQDTSSNPQSFTIERVIPPGIVPFDTTLDLRDYAMQAIVTSNAVHYEVQIKTLELDTTQFSTVDSASTVAVRVQFSPRFYIKSIQGIMRPYSFVINDTIGLPEIRLGSNFAADSILLNNDSLKIYMQTAAGHPIDIVGEIVGLRADGSAAPPITLEPSGSPNPNAWRFRPGAQNVILITGGKLNRFLANFPNGQPSKLVIRGNSLVNPYDVYANPADPNHVGSIVDTMNLYPAAEFSVPLSVAVYNGEFKDTVLIGDTTTSGTKIDPNLLTSIISGSFNFVINNGIPVNLTLSSKFVKANGDSLLAKNIPVLGGQTSSQSVTLSQSEAKKFTDAKRSIMKLLLFTGPTGAVFDTTQSVRVRMYANIKFNVNPTK